MYSTASVVLYYYSRIDCTYVGVCVYNIHCIRVYIYI